jgi:hypothetical protein
MNKYPTPLHKNGSRDGWEGPRLYELTNSQGRIRLYLLTATSPAGRLPGKRKPARGRRVVKGGVGYAVPGNAGGQRLLYSAAAWLPLFANDEPGDAVHQLIMETREDDLWLIRSEGDDVTYMDERFGFDAENLATAQFERRDIPGQHEPAGNTFVLRQVWLRVQSLTRATCEGDGCENAGSQQHEWKVLGAHGYKINVRDTRGLGRNLHWPGQRLREGQDKSHFPALGREPQERRLGRRSIHSVEAVPAVAKR